MRGWGKNLLSLSHFLIVASYRSRIKTFILVFPVSKLYWERKTFYALFNLANETWKFPSCDLSALCVCSAGAERKFCEMKKISWREFFNLETFFPYTMRVLVFGVIREEEGGRKELWERLASGCEKTCIKRKLRFDKKGVNFFSFILSLFTS